MQALQAPESHLLEARLGVVASDLSRSLRSNAALSGERQRHPEIEREEIAQPVFIIGINRTGTTYLHRLLARDPRFWTLRSYELADPVVPNGAYADAWTDADIRRARLRDAFTAAGFAESFAGVHHIDVDEPEEDLGILRYTFSARPTVVLPLQGMPVSQNIAISYPWMHATIHDRARIIKARLGPSVDTVPRIAILHAPGKPVPCRAALNAAHQPDSSAVEPRRRSDMGDSEGRIAVERDNVETMLTILKRLRGAFNPDLSVLKENAPGIAAFCERLDLGAERLEMLLDNTGDPIPLQRENVESMLDRLRKFRGNFNPDIAALKEHTPGVAAFAERLERATERLEAALK